MMEEDSVVNQFLFNYVDDENFDEAKSELIQILRIANDFPDFYKKLVDPNP